MTAAYTFDVFSSLDGFGSYSAGNWGGYWGKQGPELLEASICANSRYVLAPKTIRCCSPYKARRCASSSGPCLPQ